MKAWSQITLIIVVRLTHVADVFLIRYEEA